VVERRRRWCRRSRAAGESRWAVEVAGGGVRPRQLIVGQWRTEDDGGVGSWGVSPIVFQRVNWNHAIITVQFLKHAITIRLTMPVSL
jgi:hypothetical protein